MSILQDFNRNGFGILQSLVAEDECAQILGELSGISANAGSRCLLEHPSIRSLAARLRSIPALAPLLPDGAIPVQCTLFVKGRDTNWGVAPHQDLSIPVAARVDAQGFSGWSVKEGVHYTQPPQAILESLLAVRLQLDPASATTGPLQVVPGSHRYGRLRASQLQAVLSRSRPVPCIVPCGGAVVLRPLIVHSSGKASAVGFRRVLHFLFGPVQLPYGLRWAYAN